MLQQMRESADSPPRAHPQESRPSAEESNNVRFVRELKQAQEEKANALRKIARLQEQIAVLQQQQRQQSEPPASPGKQQSSTQVGFLSPLTNAASPIRVGSITPSRTRVATPHPKRLVADEQARKFLSEATQSTPVEYFSDVATYTVRVPYGSGQEKNAELWVEAGTQSLEAYQVTADVSKSSTLEVVAKIKADNSLLTLSGVSTVRHRSGNNQWKVYDDVDDMDKPLGCVTFIDEKANEKEYWLGKDQFIGWDMLRDLS
jgi:hypothetical protein